MKTLFLSLLCLLMLINYAQARTIKVMAYNVHNLFDTKHDEGKNDWEYLPKDYPGKKEACEKESHPRYRNNCLRSDWTQEKFNIKLKQLAKVINANKKPDILALSEVENKAVVQALADELGYKKVIVTNSPDHRGIDVALVFNEDSDIKFVKSKEFRVKGDKDLKRKPTRNILEVVLDIAGEPISFFVNHWPSQGGPTKLRVRAAKTLKKKINRRARRSEGHKFIALGDFNTIESDYPHPFKSELLPSPVDLRDKRAVNKNQKRLQRERVQERMLRAPHLIDLHDYFTTSRQIDFKKKKVFPKGSYFYVRDMRWNMLDRIFFSNNLLDKGRVQINASSYLIETPSFATKDFRYTDEGSYLNGTIIKNIPYRSAHWAETAEKAGYSDHFPISVNLVIK